MAGGAEEEREELDEDELEQEEQAVAAAGRPKQTRRKKSRMVGPLWRLEGMQVARACLHAPLPAPADRPAPPAPVTCVPFLARRLTSLLAVLQGRLPSDITEDELRQW